MTVITPLKVIQGHWFQYQSKAHMQLLSFFLSLWRCTLSCITGSAVALHCCKVHAKINRKMGNSTPCKIVTPESIILKLSIRDYVGEMTHQANFGLNRCSGGFSPNRRNVTTWCYHRDFFDFPVLSCPYLFFSILRPGRTAGPIFTLYGSNDVFPPKDCPFGGKNDGWPYLGEICPQNPPKMVANRQFLYGKI